MIYYLFIYIIVQKIFLFQRRVIFLLQLITQGGSKDHSATGIVPLFEVGSQFYFIYKIPFTDSISFPRRISSRIESVWSTSTKY